jgi:hypothetical protein
MKETEAGNCSAVFRATNRSSAGTSPALLPERVFVTGCASFGRRQHCSGVRALMSVAHGSTDKHCLAVSQEISRLRLVSGSTLPVMLHPADGSAAPGALRWSWQRSRNGPGRAKPPHRNEPDSAWAAPGMAGACDPGKKTACPGSS